MKKNSSFNKAVSVIKSTQKSVSKFGGKPNLPSSISWPRSVDGQELNFLAQIYFPEVPTGTALPENGTLFFFYNNSDNWKVVYTEDDLPNTPSEPDPNGTTPLIYHEVCQTFKISGNMQNDLTPCHQMLGKYFCIQHENLVPGYLLLLQLDSDWGKDAPGWIWGDIGIIYIFIKPEDLRAKRFDRVKVMWECC